MRIDSKAFRAAINISAASLAVLPLTAQKAGRVQAVYSKYNPHPDG